MKTLLNLSLSILSWIALSLPSTLAQADSLRSPVSIMFRCNPTVHIDPELYLNGLTFNVESSGYRLKHEGNRVFLSNNQNGSSLLLGTLTHPNWICTERASGTGNGIQLDAELRIRRDERLGVCLPAPERILWAVGVVWVRSVHARYELRDSQGERAVLETDDELTYRTLKACLAEK